MRITIAKCLFVYEVLLVLYLMLFVMPSSAIQTLLDVGEWGSVEVMAFLNLSLTSLVFWVLIFRSGEDSFFNKRFTIGSSESPQKRKQSKKKKTERKRRFRRKKKTSTPSASDDSEESLPLF